MWAVEAIGLSRVYASGAGWFRTRGARITAVRDVSFQVPEGELFGLLGPNGAGKTTTMRMLTTLLLPTAGTARVLGHDVARDPVPVRRVIGAVSGGDRGLYDRLSALDNLRYFAELYGVEPRVQRARIGELLELVGLTGRARDRVEGYSRGMRQRLHVARALLHRPKVLFLDEPTAGLDPLAARDLRQTVARLVASGTTVLLTTHYMAEADQLCDRIAVISDGVVCALGTPAALKDQVKERDVLEVEVYGAAAEHIARIEELAGVRGTSVEEREHLQVLAVHTDRGAGLLGPVVAALDGLRLGKVATREPSLEDAYLAILQESGRESAAEVRA
ncbi:ABC transporter ATP-binding protein [Streptosporangiaceae bacterium NEAU-GS5]|nr:ABC transporter ATP-binding protein [Streptosporangiaceae bacterium NEAU-GS5]